MPARREPYISIAKLRGMAFAISTAQAIGCECTGAAVAASLAKQDITLLADAAVPQELRRAWRRRFEGAEASVAIRKNLYEVYPALRMVYDNVLWSALDPHLRVDQTEAQLFALRLNGRPLPGYSPTTLRALCGCPCWQRLGILIMLLRSLDNRFYLERLWLQRKFTHYCVLACARPIHRRFAQLLYPLINELLCSGQLGQIYAWPRDLTAFEQRVSDQAKLGQCLIERGWVRCWDERCVLWLWVLGEPRQGMLIRELLAAPVEQEVERPRRIYTRTGRVLRQQADLRLTFAT